MPIAPLQQYHANFGKIVDITLMTYQNMIPDVNQLDRKFTKEELVYYATAMLWLRLIDIKSKQRMEALTSVEKELLKRTKDIAWNIPQPIYMYLGQIGNVIDKMGKETILTIPPLPTTVVQGLGGYHAAEINLQNHNLFEELPKELPSLGIAADVVMAASSQVDAPAVNIRVERLANSLFTRNLTGYISNIGSRRQEIRQRLAGLGITANAFPELVATSRFNLVYLLQISELLKGTETFKVKTITTPSMTIHVGETMIIQTIPNELEDLGAVWSDRTVQAQSSASDSTARMGAAYIFGFQSTHDGADP